MNHNQVDLSLFSIAFRFAYQNHFPFLIENFKIATTTKNNSAQNANKIMRKFCENIYQKAKAKANNETLLFTFAAATTN